MKLYQCPNNCHAAYQSMRCPHCFEWLQYRGEMHPQEAHDMLLREQTERAKATGLSDFKPRDDARTRAIKEHYKREEAKYYHQLNKQNGH